MKRKNFLINPKFQLNFIAWVTFIATVVLIIFYLANLFFLYSYIQQGKQAGLPQDHIFFTFLWKQFRIMNWIFAISGLISFLFIFFSGIFLSHRVAGPLFKLRKYLDSVAEGNEPEYIRFRKHDYFKEIETAYNRHIDAIKSKNHKKLE